jgi:hypothetical protein|tara:strand:+ start:887 stop:1090 length:204 start_codon:yes stop_codon:yes gene_type:complete
MDFERGETTKEIIENTFCMFYFNIQTGDYTMKYCEEEMLRNVEAEEYEIAEGIKKAINFKKYGDSTL